MGKKPVEEKSLAGLKVQSGKDNDTLTRMAILLWGPANVGKTTLAATAPGNKLWLSFGDNEHVPVMHRSDVEFVNLSDMPYDDLFKQAQSDNPFGLDKYLAENEDVHSLVVDSVTAVEYKALQKSVGERVGASRNFTPTMEAPGISAYGGRNAILLQTLTGLLRVTAKHNVHIICTAHEADATMVEGSDTIDYYAIQLGGRLVNGMTWRFSEIWHMFQETSGMRERGLLIRNGARKRKPMKTRMFDMRVNDTIWLNYDPDKPDKGQTTIASFYEAWADNGYRRIPVPVKKK